MYKPLILASVGAIALAACGEAERASESSADAVEAASASSERVADAAAAPESGLPMPAAIPASMPKLAYTYGLSFEAESAEIGKLMRRHATICEQQGAQSCRIVGMDLSGSAEREDVRGTLQLAVASTHARAVSALLEDEAADIGAQQTATTIGSEEVSKTITDTEARIRARVELRDRLMEVLRTRKGSVQELVEAERQVAAVNEEIDQARSWLKETQGRVAFSQMDIDYAPRSAIASGFTAPIASAFGSLGSVFGYVIAALMLVGALLAPIFGVAWAGRAINRRMAATSES